jgi:hypothetical protein
MFLRNVDIYLQVLIALQPRRPTKVAVSGSGMAVLNVPVKQARVSQLGFRPVARREVLVSVRCIIACSYTFCILQVYCYRHDPRGFFVTGL